MPLRLEWDFLSHLEFSRKLSCPVAVSNPDSFFHPIPARRQDCAQHFEPLEKMFCFACRSIADATTKLQNVRSNHCARRLDFHNWATVAIELRQSARRKYHAPCR